MNNEMYTLEPRYDSRASFYDKAKVFIKEDSICYNELLYSYDTLVAIYIKDKMGTLEEFSYLGKYSQTTTRHQKEFFKQKGLSDKQIKELMKKGVLETRDYTKYLEKLTQIQSTFDIKESE